MKKNNMQAKTLLEPLNENEMVEISGGMDFWELLGYVPGVIVGSLLAVGKAAAEYQASLPPNLKK